MKNKKDNNALVIGIGMLFVILVFLFTFLRPVIFKKNKTTVESFRPETKELKTGKKMTSHELADRIAKKEKIVIIDIRENEDYSTSHIVDSRNVPSDKIVDTLSFLDKNENLLLVDDFGESVVDLVGEVFEKNGFSQAYYLEGGITAWRNQGNPTIIDADPYSMIDQSKVSYIKCEDLKKLMEHGESLFIIDLRKKENFNTGHIKNSSNIYLGDLEKRRNEIPFGKKIILVDEDGLWAFKGAVQLFDMGIMNTYALSDGLVMWKEKGYELVN